MTKYMTTRLLPVALAILTVNIGSAQTTPFETLYSFQGHPDGASPKGALLIDKSGALYGTTEAGGTSGLGTVFALTHATGGPSQESVLHNFTGPDGQYPLATLAFGGAGVFYGTTFSSSSGTGTIFELAPPTTAGGAWMETVLYTFPTGLSQNQFPNCTLVIGRGGTLYTTTEGVADGPGGPHLGLLVSLAPPSVPGGQWMESQLYTFGFPQGDWPIAGVVSASGSLFGTTFFGGDEFCGEGGCGTVYELTPPATPGGAWTETTLHIFTGASTDGGGPQDNLTVGPGGVLYGTTQYGGSGSPSVCVFGNGSGCGTVFRLTPPATPGGAWTESILYSFTGVSGDGAYPLAGVVLGKDGALYGTNQSGGIASSACPPAFSALGGCGTVFELTPPAVPGGPWVETILHSFSGLNGDGSMPLAGLAMSSSGVLYGTTSAGGTAGKGTVFALRP